jgi:hydrocephalus-inducing protein
VITGSVGRIPIMLAGLGIGHKAGFDFDELDAGDLFVDSQHSYEVNLVNHGDIDVEFRLVNAVNLDVADREKKVTNSKHRRCCFRFSPTEGSIPAGETAGIRVDFCPDRLGEFEEIFEWELVGSNTIVPLTFRGHCVAPTLSIDVEKINFGIVSYGVVATRTFTITNTSEVPIKFILTVTHADGGVSTSLASNKNSTSAGLAGHTDENHENGSCLDFELVPSRGSLFPGSSQKVLVQFVPSCVNLKKVHYEFNLSVDLEGIGIGMSVLPIVARCGVPSIQLDPSDNILDFGKVFVMFPFHRSLVIHNTSTIPAKFEVLLPLALASPLSLSPAVAVEVDQMFGTIPAASSHVLAITLTALQPITEYRTPLQIQILGQEQPHNISLEVTAVGPKVRLELTSTIFPSTSFSSSRNTIDAIKNNDISQQQPVVLDFGLVECLKSVSRTFKLVNDCCIEAAARVFMKSAASQWSVDKRFVTLVPHEAVEIIATVVATEPGKLNDQIVVTVVAADLNRGSSDKNFVFDSTTESDLILGVSAKAFGTPIRCPQAKCGLQQHETSVIIIDLGVQSATNQVYHEIVLHNLGRKMRRIQWQQQPLFQQQQQYLMLSVLTSTAQCDSSTNLESNTSTAMAALPPPLAASPNVFKVVMGFLFFIFSGCS